MVENLEKAVFSWALGKKVNLETLLVTLRDHGLQSFADELENISKSQDQTRNKDMSPQIKSISAAWILIIFLACLGSASAVFIFVQQSHTVSEPSFVTRTSTPNSFSQDLDSKESISYLCNSPETFFRNFASTNALNSNLSEQFSTKTNVYLRLNNDVKEVTNWPVKVSKVENSFSEAYFKMISPINVILVETFNGDLEHFIVFLRSVSNLVGELRIMNGSFVKNRSEDKRIEEKTKLHLGKLKVLKITYVSSCLIERFLKRLELPALKELIICIDDPKVFYDVRLRNLFYKKGMNFQITEQRCETSTSGNLKLN